MTIIKPRIPANAETMSRDELEGLIRFNDVQIQRADSNGKPFFWTGQFLLIPTLLFSWFGSTPQYLAVFACQLICLAIYSFFAVRGIRGLKSNSAVLDILIERSRSELERLMKI
jgi:hypothetical protein